MRNNVQQDLYLPAQNNLWPHYYYKAWFLSSGMPPFKVKRNGLFEVPYVFCEKASMVYIFILCCTGAQIYSGTPLQKSWALKKVPQCNNYKPPQKSLTYFCHVVLFLGGGWIYASISCVAFWLLVVRFGGRV